eukprot:UN17756
MEEEQSSTLVEEMEEQKYSSGWELKINDTEKEIEPKSPEAKPPDKWKEKLEGGGGTGGDESEKQSSHEGDVYEQSSAAKSAEDRDNANQKFTLNGPLDTNTHTR